LPVLKNPRNVRTIKRGLPEILCPSDRWEYILHPAGKEIHMAMIAEDLIELINNPKQVQNTREEIEKIPRDFKGPFEATLEEPAWGIHAIQGRSVRKFLAWNFFLVVIGIIGAILCTRGSEGHSSQQQYRIQRSRQSLL
jgi:hypothetical protein